MENKNDKPPKLTRKQAEFVKGIAQGKPAVHAALDAYDTDDYNVAGSIAVENLQKPTIREAIDKAMVASGLDAPALLKPIKDALEAENQYGADHTTRLKASELGLKLSGALGQKGEGTNVSINFNQHVNEKRGEYGL